MVEKIFEYLQRRKLYGVMILIGLFLFFEWIKPHIGADSISAIIFPQEIIHQRDIINLNSGIVVIKNHITSENTSIKNWSISLYPSTTCAEIHRLKISSRTHPDIPYTQHGLVIVPKDSVVINPGDFIKIEYTLNDGLLNDIVLSGTDFGIRWSSQNWLLLFLYALGIIISVTFITIVTSRWNIWRQEKILSKPKKRPTKTVKLFTS